MTASASEMGGSMHVTGMTGKVEAASSRPGGTPFADSENGRREMPGSTGAVETRNQVRPTGVPAMNVKSFLTVVAILIMASLMGCSSSPKLAKSASTASTDSLSASAKKVQQDFSQTQTDFSKLESEAHFPK